MFGRDVAGNERRSPNTWLGRAWGAWGAAGGGIGIFVLGPDDLVNTGAGVDVDGACAAAFMDGRY